MSAPKKSPPVRKPRKKREPLVLEGSAEAKRLASLIIEVLGGLRTPADASAAGGITLQRYYRLETRALQGIVTALEPRPRGKRPSADKELVKLQAERDRLEREVRRANALVRVAQRTVGLPPAPTPATAKKGATTKSGKGRRKRKPRARVRQALERLQRAEPPSAAPKPGETPAKTASA